jgi:hypothetical protein
MTGIYMLLLLAVFAVVAYGYHESTDIADDSPPAPPTKDAYSV